VAHAFLDRVKSGPGIVAFMSSGLGSVAQKTDSYSELYSASKAALNSLSRSLAASLGRQRVTVLAIAPGWVRTDMGGQGATLSVEESVRGIVDVIESRAGTGRHGFVDYRGRDVAWGPRNKTPSPHAPSRGARARACRVAHQKCARGGPPRQRRSGGRGLLRRFLHLRGGQRFAAGPGVLGDVEQDALGPVHLDFEPARPLGVALVHVVLAAVGGDHLRRLVEILDEDAEMVQPGVVHALADLVGLEAQD